MFSHNFSTIVLIDTLIYQKIIYSLALSNLTWMNEIIEMNNSNRNKFLWLYNQFFSYFACFFLFWRIFSTCLQAITSNFDLYNLIKFYITELRSNTCISQIIFKNKTKHKWKINHNFLCEKKFKLKIKKGSWNKVNEKKGFWL